MALCLHPRCPEPPVYRGRCAAHSRAKERGTNRAGRKVYNTKRWQIVRRRVLFEQPLCAEEGCDEIATDVDHIVPIAKGGDPFARSNLAALCHSHHSQKTRREQIDV